MVPQFIVEQRLLVLPPPLSIYGFVINLVTASVQTDYERQTVIKRDIWLCVCCRLLVVVVENVPLVSSNLLLLHSPLHLVLLLQNVLRVAFKRQVMTSRRRKHRFKEVRVGKASYLGRM